MWQYFSAVLPRWPNSSDARGLSQIINIRGAITRAVVQVQLFITHSAQKQFADSNKVTISYAQKTLPVSLAFQIYFHPILEEMIKAEQGGILESNGW